MDAANSNEMWQANEMGVKQGVTTNQSLIAKEAHDFIEVLKEAISIVDGPISVGVISMKSTRLTY